MEPDPQLREALHAIDAQHEGLSPDARRRIARTVAERGPGEVARSRRARAATIGAGLCVAAAAAAWLVGIAGPSEVTAPVAHRPATTTPLEAPAACTARSVPLHAQLVEQPGGERLLDLGPRAQIVGASGTEARIATLTSCALEIALDRGTVTVDAEDLGGGTLVVRTAEARVSVHGTRFDVERDAAGTRVRVREGVVAVDVGGEPTELLRAGDETLVPPRAPARAGQAPETRAGQAPETRAGQAPETRAGQAPETRAGQAPPRHAPERLDAETLSRRGAQRERDGDLDGARADYGAAMRMRGLAAEAASLSLARLELRAGRMTEARRAIEAHDRRFPRGSLTVEAEWIAVQIARRAGDEARARALAERLVREHPGSAQARAASAWSNDGNGDGEAPPRSTTEDGR